MSIDTDSAGPGCVWLEFSGERGESDISHPYPFVRLIGPLIEGGEQHETVAALRAGRWLTGPWVDDRAAAASAAAPMYSRVSALGVYSVHLEERDGNDLTLDCSQVQIDGLLLLVNGLALARLDEPSGTWIRLHTDSRLHGIRMEPESPGKPALEDDAWRGALSHAERQVGLRAGARTSLPRA